MKISIETYDMKCELIKFMYDLHILKNCCFVSQQNTHDVEPVGGAIYVGEWCFGTKALRPDTISIDIYSSFNGASFGYTKYEIEK